MSFLNEPTHANLLCTIENVRCYYGPQQSKLISGKLELISFQNFDSEESTAFLQITSTDEKTSENDLVTISLIPGFTRIHYPQQSALQFTVTNLPDDHFFIQFPLQTSMEEASMIGDMLMQLVSFTSKHDQQPSDTGPSPSSSNVFSVQQQQKQTQLVGNGVGTTFQGPLQQTVPPQSLALVTPDGNVLGVVSNKFNESNAVSSSPSNSTVMVDNSTSNVSLLDTAGSWAVKGASYIGAGIVFGAAMLGTGLKSGSDYLVKNTTPAQKPVQISQGTKNNLQTVSFYSQKAVDISHTTAETVSSYAKSTGRSIGRRMNKTGNGENKPSTSMNLIRNAVQVVDVLGTSLEHGMKSFVADAKVATSNYVGYKYGVEAKAAAETSMGVIENATLVYIDARGISRRALVKAVGYGAVTYKLKDGREVSMKPLQDGSMEITKVTNVEK